MKPFAAAEKIAPWQFDMYVDAEADGIATPEQLAILEGDGPAWRVRCRRSCSRPRSISPARKRRPGRSATRWSPTSSGSCGASPGVGPARSGGRGSGDPRRERVAVWTERCRTVQREQPEEPELEPVHVQLQLSWEPWDASAWGGGAGCRPRTPKKSWQCSPPRERRHRGGASTARCRCPPGVERTRSRFPSATSWAGWSPPVPVKLATTSRPASAGWGRVAVWAVELTASGAMVPLLRRRDCAAARARARPTARTRCDGRRRSSTRRGLRALRRTHARFGARPRPRGRPRVR